MFRFFLYFFRSGGPLLGFLVSSFMEKLNFQAVIKSAASAASRNPRRAHGRRLGWRATETARLPWDSWRLRYQPT